MGIFFAIANKLYNQRKLRAQRLREAQQDGNTPATTYNNNNVTADTQSSPVYGKESINGLGLAFTRSPGIINKRFIIPPNSSVS